MALTLARLEKRRARLTFEYDDEPVTLAYYPAAITPRMLTDLNAWQERANAAGQEDEAAMVLEFATWYCGIIAEWSLLEAEDGPAIPVTPERIAQLLNEQGGAAMDFLAECLKQAVEAMTLGKPNGTGSLLPSASTPSRTAKRAARSQTGLRTSRSRATRG